MLSLINGYHILFPVALTLMILLYVATAIVCFYGNFMVLWIIRTTKSLQNMNNLLVANLAICDICIGIFITPFQWYGTYMQRWDLPVFMCKLLPFVQYVLVNVNMFNLILIAQDRCYIYSRVPNSSIGANASLDGYFPS